MTRATEMCNGACSLQNSETRMNTHSYARKEKMMCASRVLGLIFVDDHLGEDNLLCLCACAETAGYSPMWVIWAQVLF